MTDNDLIQQLRNSKGWPTLGNAAADHIEALIAERDALTDALVDAEAERHRWRQAASIGSIHTQVDLDRAVKEARAVALEEAAEHHLRHARGYNKTGQEQDAAVHTAHANAILALLDTPAAEALERVRAEERERLCRLMEGLAGEFGFVDVPMADSVNQSMGMPRVGDQFAARMRTFVAAIRARGET